MIRHMVAALVVITVSVGMVAAQFLYPHQQRQNLRIDDKIVQDIKAIKREIDDHVDENNSLPDDLSALNPNEKLQNRIEELSYEYSPKNNKYQLCAKFRTDASDKEEDNRYDLFASFSRSSRGDFETEGPDKSENPEYHKKGRQCYTYDAPIRRSSSSGSFELDSNNQQYLESLRQLQ